MSPDDTALARTALQQLTAAEPAGPWHVRTGAGKEEVVLPEQAARALREVLVHLSEGSRVVVVPSPTELSTQQAADILNVSRPYLVGLLDQGQIPFRKVGAHRRIRMVDLLAYKERDDAQRRHVADLLAAEGQAPWEER